MTKLEILLNKFYATGDQKLSLADHIHQIQNGVEYDEVVDELKKLLEWLNGEVQ